MRVLFVINSLGAGGAERSLAEMLGPLSARGVQPVVACFDRDAQGPEAEVLARGFDVRFLDGHGLVKRVRQLHRLIRAFEPDIVHTTIFEADVAGRLAAVGTGAAVVTSLVNTSYDPVRLQDPNVKKVPLLAHRLVDGWTARHLTDHFHAITEAVKDAAVTALGVPPDRVSVIERGRDVRRLGEPGAGRRREARQRLGLSDDDEVVVNIGRQEFQKGQISLFEAMKLLLPDRSRLVVLQAGRQGQESTRLRSLAAGLGDRVRLLGYREDVPDLLAAADVFVFPSRYEGLGGSLIEAMALALPIVASDIPAIREVVEPGANALLVAPDRAADLAEAVARLLDDPDCRRSFARRSREIFEQRFTLERSVERTLAMYRPLVARPGANP